MITGRHFGHPVLSHEPIREKLIERAEETVKVVEKRKA